MAWKRCPLNQLHVNERVCISMFRRTDVEGNRACNYYDADTKGCKYDWIPVVCK